MRRAIALELADQTIKNPLAIIVQAKRDEQGNAIPNEPGRKVYIAMFKDDYLNANNIIVGVEEGQEGRIVTSFASAGDKRHKNKALKDFKKSISAAVQVLYLGLGLSGHPRPASGQRASTGDASLHSSGKQIISQTGDNGNNTSNTILHFRRIVLQDVIERISVPDHVEMIAQWFGRDGDAFLQDEGRLAQGEGVALYGIGIISGFDDELFPEAF